MRLFLAPQAPLRIVLFSSHSSRGNNSTSLCSGPQGVGHRSIHLGIDWHPGNPGPRKPWLRVDGTTCRRPRGGARGRGKLAPGSRPADTPSGTIAFAGASGSSSWSPPYSLRRVRSHWDSNGVYGKRMDPSLDPLRRTSKRAVVETRSIFPTLSLLGRHLKRRDAAARSQRETCTPMSTAASVTRVQRGKQPECPSRGEEGKKTHDPDGDRSIGRNRCPTEPQERTHSCLVIAWM